MSYDMGGSDLRVVQGINLILNVMKQLEKLKKELEGISGGWQRFGVFDQTSQLKLIVGTAADKIANEYLVKKLNELNGELDWKFPHKGIIMRKTQEALNAGRIALSRHFQKWESAKIGLVTKSLGSQSLLDEPNVLPTRLNSYDVEEESMD
jgi:hypothetical protein